jgi:hypothetical protein
MFYAPGVIAFMIVKQHREFSLKHVLGYQLNGVNVKIKKSQPNGIKVIGILTVIYIFDMIPEVVSGTVFVQFTRHSVRPMIPKLSPF